MGCFGGQGKPRACVESQNQIFNICGWQNFFKAKNSFALLQQAWVTLASEVVMRIFISLHKAANPTLTVITGILINDNTSICFALKTDLTDIQS